MEFLDTVILDNDVRAWLIALGLTIAVAVVLRLVVRQVLRAIDRWAKGTNSEFDDLLVELGRRTKSAFYFTAGLYVGSRTLDLPPIVRDAFE